MAEAMKPGSNDDSRYRDTYGSINRRLATFAQCFAMLLGQPANPAQFLDKAVAIGDLGFAGFQMPACLSLAESAEVCVPGLAVTPEKALEVARTGALLDLAQKGRSTVTTGTSSPFHPGSPG